MPIFNKIKDKSLIICASVIGNVVELFDLTLYIVLLPKIALKFFPFESILASLLSSLVVFSFAFFARPFGALLFGLIGDKYGRRIALIYSILVMSVSTFLIGLLPTYESIGVAAPFLLVLLRMLQGLSMGGEFASSSVFLIECLNKKEGLAAGITISSVVFGSVAANYVVHLVIFENMPEYAWRFPFLIGGLLAGIGVCFRIIIEETPEYKRIVSKKQVSHFPIKEILRDYLYELIIVIGVCSYAGAIAYTIMGYTTIHFSTILNLNLGEAISVNYIGLCTFSLSAIFFGVISDKIGAGKMLLISSFAGFMSGFPIFYSMEFFEKTGLFFQELLLGLLAGSYCSAQLFFISKFFPTRIRCTAVCLGHAIGIALLGGTFPFISLFLINQFNHTFMPGIYLSLSAILGMGFALLGTRLQRRKNNRYL